ncbi:hypothetical protein PYW08_004349 [Mythimna loreyi]|uniref:Uncharacterized protein n=1 Tax=Mythimna loreyi TaxID=667449 RepID=A0ACC2QNM2_9NEOP|nr:hypothetical protein PYW08_004349 [Mythimna loreyi]
MLRHLTVLLSFSCVTSELLNLHEGSSCTRNGINGKCVSVYNCLSSYLDFKTKDFAPICTFRDREPIICCTDCSFNDTRNFFINPNVGVIHKTGNKVQDKCIEHIHTLDYPCKGNHDAQMKRTYNPEKNCNDINIIIRSAFGAVGGVNAYREEFPHMGLLGYGDDIKSVNWLCGGTVISDRFILTAGHCLASAAVGPVKYVALGILNRSDPPELWRIYNVKRRIPHPEYKPPSKYNDIALLETDTKIIFDRQVLPACLHATGEADEQLYATGWGALGHRKELADTLQKVLIWRFEADECSKYYPPHRHLKNGYNHSTQMCYGDKNGRDTCEGDSGGPLQTSSNDYVKNIYCVYTVAGVTSYGRQCGVAGGSGIYTRVIHYIPWIESIVWP